MRIAFNPSTVAALTSPPNNKDITFDLRGQNIFARGVKFYGTDTNTWRDIKVNNVSIGSHTLDLRNGSNTTLTNTNGVVTINSTWRPVVDSLTSDSTTSSLSAKQGKVLKGLLDGKSNTGHTHDDRYLRLSGGTMNSDALITFADSGSWGTDKGPQGARGGLRWTGQSDSIKLYAEETAANNLDLVIQFGDDNSNGLSIRNKTNTQTSYISASGVITTGTFKGNLDWSYITNKPATATRWPSWAEVTGKPSSFTPSTHTHGLSNSVFFLNMPSISGNAKWKEVFGYPVNYNLLLSVRINSPAPEWCVGNYGSGILYGGSDTKGFMSSAYNEPLIMWAGGNGSSDDSVPKWYIGIRGTHKSIYNLTTIASEANAAYNLRHSHSNKSVLDGITSGLVSNWNTAYNFVHTITGTDTDNVINKWDEIVNFLAGITEDNKLNTLLNSKLSVYELADKTNVGTIKNNGIYYSTIDASSGTLTNSPFNTGFALINMTSYDGGDDLRRSRLAFNAYGEIKVSDDRSQLNTAETWYNVLTSKNSGISDSTIKLNGTSITVYSSGTADNRYVKKSGDTMTGALNFANGTWNLVGDDSYMGDCNVSGHFGIKAANTTYPGIAFFNNANAYLGSLTAYSGNIKYGAYSLQFLDNGNTSVGASTWTNPFSAYDKNAVKDGQAICVWGQSSHLSNLSTDSGDMTLWLKRVNAKVATLNMVLDGEYYANGSQRLAHISEIPSSLKNPYALTISLNGTSQGPYDGSAAKSINITPGSIGAATSGHNHDGRYVYNYGGTQMDGSSRNKNALGMSTTSGISGNWWHILQAAWNDEYRWNSQIAFPTQNRNGMYYRSGLDDNTKWGAWVKLLDTGNSYVTNGKGVINGTTITQVDNADKLDGYHANTSQAPFGLIPTVGGDGVMEIGKYIDFHNDNGGKYDYSTRLQTTGNYQNTISLPSGTGTLALTSQIPNKNSWNYDDRYLRLTGGTMQLGEGLKFHADDNYFGTYADARIISLLDDNDKICDGGLIIDERGTLDGKEYVTELLRIRDSEFKWRGNNILHGGNYSSILDSRYYTESEVNNLLSKKLDRVNLTTGIWNPRGYSLAADYHYNGGDLSISENGGKMYVSIDGQFYQNEGQYRVLDTSDIGSIRGSLTLYQYLSSTDTNWFPLIWGGSDHKNTNNSTGSLYKSYDKLSWQTSSQTLYATKLKTTNLDTQTALFHPDNDSTLKIYSGRTQDAVSDGHIGLQTSIDNTDGQTHVYPTQYGSRCVLALQPRGGSVYIGNMPNGGNGRKLNVNGDIGLFNTGSIRDLAIGGGIYWNPYVESATDGSDAASITVVKAGVAGGTTLVLSQQNDANDTIQFKTSTAARLYHNSNQILTSGDTKVSSGKGYINNTEITQVNNSDTLDGWHKDNIQWTGYITSPNSLTSYWFKMYDITVTGYQYNDITITFLVSEGFSSNFSIFYLRIRQNGTNNSENYNLGVSLKELVGNLRDKVVAYYNNSTGNVQLWGNTENQWSTMNYTVIKKTTRTATDSSSLGTLTAQSFSSVQTPPSTGYTKLTMSRVGSVSYSDSTGSVHWNNVTNKPSTFNPAAHTHTVFKNNLMIKGTNGISDSASIHLGIGDSDTGFKWISDGKCQIYANNTAVGEWTSGGMNWLRNPTVNGNKVWNAGNDGSGSGLDADLLDGEHASSFVRAGVYKGNDLNKLDTYSFIRSVNSNNKDTSPKSNTGWYNVIQLVHRNGASDGASYIGQIALGMTTNTDDMFFRGKRTDSWKTVIHSGNIGSQTVASATKLQTARNLWGQSFNGTSDVNGTIYINNSDSSNGAIRLNNNVNANARISAIGGQVIFNTGAAIRFGETTWDWNKWAGLKYDSSTKTIYLGIADDSVFNANSAQRGGTINLKAGIDYLEAPRIKGYCKPASWLEGMAEERAGIIFQDGDSNGAYYPWIRQKLKDRYYSIGLQRTQICLVGSITSRTDNGYDASWRFDISNGWAYGNFQNADTVDGKHASDFASAGHTHDGRYLKLSGGTLTGGIEIQGTISGSNYASSEGFYTNEHNSLILRGDATYGKSGILFTSSKGTNSINQTSDKGFIQFQSYGGTNTTGEENKLVIGVGNDSTDMVYIQTPSVTGLKHVVGTNPYTIWDSGNLTKLSQLTNDKGFVTGSVNGKTITINGTSTTWSNTWRPISDDYEKGDASTSLSTLGSLTLYNDLLSAIPTIPTIPNPTNYYWANIKVSSSSSTTTSPTVNVLTATRVCAGHDPGISNSISCSNWFRSSGETGWYSSTYGGGWYMSDKDWIRSWGSKALYINNSIRSTNYQVMYGSTSASAARLESTTTLVYGTDTSSNSINSYLRGTTVTLQVKKGTSINHNALQLTADYIYCNNYCDMKQGAVVSGGNFTVNNNSYLAQSAGAKVGIGTSSLSDSLSVNGSMNVKLTNVNWDKACTDKSLVIRKTTLDPSKVNSYEYVSKVLTFQFGDGTHSNNRGTCTVSVPAGYKIQMDVYDLKTTHNRPIANIQVSGTNTLQMTLGGGYYISGTDSANVSYFLVPDAPLDFPKTTVPQLLIADSTIQFQNSDKLLALTNKGVYINGAVNLQINGYHKQPIFIASAIYNKSSWNTIECRANAALITCNTPIADCTVNDFIVQYSGVTVTSVRIENFKFVCVLGDTNGSYYGVQIYYMPH